MKPMLSVLLLVAVPALAHAQDAGSAFERAYDAVVEQPLQGASTSAPSVDVPAESRVEVAAESPTALSLNDSPPSVAPDSAVDAARANVERGQASEVDGVDALPEGSQSSATGGESSTTLDARARRAETIVAPGSDGEAPTEPPLALPVDDVFEDPSLSERTASERAPSAVPVPTPFFAPGTREAPSIVPAQAAAAAAAACDAESCVAVETEVDDARTRELATVFGRRKGPRLLGAYASLSTNLPVLGSPGAASGQLAAVLGGVFRLGVEARGLRYAAAGPDVQLVSTGWLFGVTLNPKKLVHPIADVVVGGGVVSRADGSSYGTVGTSVIRGGAEVNLTRGVRATATVGWTGIAAPNPRVRHDLNGMEVAIGVRAGWF